MSPNKKPQLIRVADTADVAPGQMLRFKIQEEWILLINLNGEFYAVSDTCSHEDASLFKGVIKGDCVQCPLHGSRFNILTGEPQEEPAELPISTYDTKVIQDSIYVDSQRRNPSTVDV